MGSVLSCKRRFTVDLARAQRAFIGIEASNEKKRDKQTVVCGLFVGAFSAFEVGIADLFSAYALGQPALDGSTAERFVIPKDKLHIVSLAKAGQAHLFWADAGRVIERSTDWFDDGFRIADALRTHKNVLDKSRKLRNYIAHRSDEAWATFRGVWTSDIGPAPTSPPHPGEFLLKRKGRRTAPTLFERYTTELSRAFDAACGGE